MQDFSALSAKAPKEKQEPHASGDDVDDDASGPALRELDGFSAVEMCKGVKWVFDNLGKAKPRKAPSNGWSEYLKLLNEDKKLKAEFFLNVLPKFIPNKNQLDRESGRHDDGIGVDKLLAKLEGDLDKVPVVQGRT